MAAQLFVVTTVLLLGQVAVEGRIQGSNNIVRLLQDDGTTTTKYTHSSWEDCLNMSPPECKQHILDSVDGDLDNHVIPNLGLVISPARSADIIAQTYWEVGIPTTVDGIVDCSLGDVRFPYDWITSDGTFTLPSWDCNGLDISTCCETILQDMEDRNIPLTDVNGNCFSCRAHQEPLEPHIDSDNVEGYFLEHYWDASTNTCDLKAYTHAEIQTIDSGVATDLISVRAQIDTVLNSSPVLCKDFVNLHNELLEYARSKPHVMSKVVGMLCGLCDALNYSDTDVLARNGGELEQSIKNDLHWIHNELAAVTIRSDYANIIIYTNADGTEVLKTPVLGGSRTGIVTDRSGPAPGPDGGNTTPVIVENECPAATMEDLKKYWIGSILNAKTAYDDSCSCPPHPGVIEYHHKCYCEGGFKLWDTTTQSCRCPYGHKEGTTECICPGPNSSDLTWNQVGWIENGSGSCKIDTECTLSELDYYHTYETGCNDCYFPKINLGDDKCVCHPGYYGYDENGQPSTDCELDCSYGNGDLVFNSQENACLCEHYPEMEYKTNPQGCFCTTDGAEWTGTKCECPAHMPIERSYRVSGTYYYYCDYPNYNDGGYNNYYNYNYRK